MLTYLPSVGEMNRELGMMKRKCFLPPRQRSTAVLQPVATTFSRTDLPDIQ